jgi:hypothetical protein
MYVAEFLKDCLSGEGYRVYREQDLPQGLRYPLSLEVPSLWDEIDLNAIRVPYLFAAFTAESPNTVCPF